MITFISIKRVTTILVNIVQILNVERASYNEAYMKNLSLPTVHDAILFFDLKALALCYQTDIGLHSSIPEVL